MRTWCEVRNFAIQKFRMTPDWTGFRKNSTGSDTDIQTTLITAVKCLIRVFFG